MKIKLMFIILASVLMVGCLNLDIIGFRLIQEKPAQNNALPIEENK